MKFTRGPGRIPSIRKSSMLWFFLTVFLLLVVYSILVILRTSPTETFKERNDDEIIYCVMITKDNRKEFMLHSVVNFLEQDYKNKRLIIISESKQVHPVLNKQNILQIPVSRSSGITLGNLRNIAFSMMPDGALFTVWDDDDVRSRDYLSKLKGELGENDFVMFTKRIEYNVNTDFAYVMELKPGFVLYFGRKNKGIEYEDVNVNEDVRLRETMKTNYKTKIYENDPKLYVRVVHSDNTSLLVNEGKTNLKDTSKNSLYFEHKINEEDLQYAREKIAIMNSVINQTQSNMISMTQNR